MIPADFLQMLRGPDTRQPLALASAEQGARANARAGSEPLAAGLVRADGKVLYPIRHGIPELLAEEAIPLV